MRQKNSYQDTGGIVSTKLGNVECVKGIGPGSGETLNCVIYE